MVDRSACRMAAPSIMHPAKYCVWDRILNFQTVKLPLTLFQKECNCVSIMTMGHLLHSGIVRWVIIMQIYHSSCFSYFWYLYLQVMYYNFVFKISWPNQIRVKVQLICVQTLKSKFDNVKIFYSLIHLFQNLNTAYLLI
jgi:hypothetical protein